MKRVAIMRTGGVGQAYASKFISLGHEAMLETRNPSEKLSDTARDGYVNSSFSEWHSTNRNVKLRTFRESARFGEIILNATKGAQRL